MNEQLELLTQYMKWVLSEKDNIAEIIELYKSTLKDIEETMDVITENFGDIVPNQPLEKLERSE